ncbi:uncharacterized protein [Procambarus clarkii]|uniref:uncharacterized protein isoform X2 n=1 Tax=Procambarus clarkii TaxID=6728 RepID=UPI003743920F
MRGECECLSEVAERKPDPPLARVPGVCEFYRVSSPASRDSCLPLLLSCTCCVSTMSVVLLVLLALLAGSRAAPQSRQAGFLDNVGPLPVWNSPPETPPRELILPDDFTIIGPCLTTILTLICNGTYATSNIDRDQRPYSLASSAEDRGKEALACRGNNCRLDRLYGYCNRSNSPSTLQQWATESEQQLKFASLPSHYNIHPGCNRHNIDMEKVLSEGGRSCMKKVDCLCDGCCYSTSKAEMLRTMLERKYSQLLIRLLSPRKSDYRRPPPKNFPISTKTRH